MFHMLFMIVCLFATDDRHTLSPSVAPTAPSSGEQVLVRGVVSSATTKNVVKGALIKLRQTSSQQAIQNIKSADDGGFSFEVCMLLTSRTS